MRKNFLLVFVSLFFAVQHAFAVPANPIPDNYTLPDGSVITLQQRGDELVNWVTTLDGFTLLLNSDGFFEYAIRDQAGNLTLSGVRAHNESKRTAEERSFVANLPEGLSFSSFQIETILEFRGLREEFLLKNDDEQYRMSGVVCTGNIRIPIILVGFPDRTFTTPKEQFEMLFNQLNLTSIAGGTVPGSLRDYFLSNSSGKLDLQVDVFGPYTMPNNILHYSISGDCPGAGGQHRTLARLALDSAFHRGGADLASYNVTSVHIIFAGYGRENGSSTCPSIWSHMSSIASPNTYNGKTFTNYSVSPEFRGTSGSNITYIGVVAHELGHSLLNLPDFYNTGTGTVVDIGAWCLMASGSWGDNGRTPARISAYGRVAAGWVSEITLSTPVDIILPNPTATDIVYRINTTTPNDYFLLENRQKTAWDASIPSSGMLIYHTRRTSSDLSVWNNNRVNATANNRRYYIKQAGCETANGCRTGTGWTNRVNDPWPRSTFTEFTDNSTPNARSWAGANTEKPVTEITHNTSARTVSFKFMGGGPPRWDIAMNRSGTHTFRNARYGYEIYEPLSVTITNEGNQPTGELTIELSGEHANDFTISKTSISNIFVGSDDHFTIAPKTGLELGTYTATVTVAGDYDLSESFDVSFTVIRANGSPVSTPMLADVTENSITVYAVETILDISDQMVEYAIQTTNDTNYSTLTWQPDTVFSSLSPSTIYYIYARSGGNTNFHVGNPSVSAPIQTSETVNIRDAEIHGREFLRAWTQDGILHIDGLTIGQIYRIFNISGILVYQSVAKSDIVGVENFQPLRGVYIIQSGNKSVKITL
ncbi:MAG: M6 family metalloprotease domain-containing protein [Bacteroidales bacterium]|nr:M6 family metalloprotease domain-containing protein [Bacteroidales bacterium]